MKTDEALYQLKQNIKMHEIEGTTSNQNEREKALLDYITNLQEENKSLRTRIKTIKRLRKKQTAKKNKYKSIIFNEEKALHDYKSRCEKASEYIMTELIDEWSIRNQGYVSGSDLPVEAITPLLNILQGEDKDVKD